MATVVAVVMAELAARWWLAPDLHWFQPVFRADPDVGYTLRPGAHGMVLGADLRANRFGYRGSEWTVARPEGVVRVAVIGDSHAFGYGVDEDRALPAVLERELAALTATPVEVLNFAIPGYTARQELAVLTEKALRFSPNAVVVVLCDNDEREDLWVDDDGWIRWDAPGTEASAAGRVHGPFLPSPRHGMLRRSRLLGFLKLQLICVSTARTPPHPGWNDPVAPGPFPDLLQREVYSPARRMLSLCRDRGIATVVALFGIDPAYRRLLATLAVNEDVAALDLLTLFPEVKSWADLGRRFGLGWDPHLGAAAHARWGQALAAMVAGELERGR